MERNSLSFSACMMALVMALLLFGACGEATPEKSFEPSSLRDAVPLGPLATKDDFETGIVHSEVALRSDANLNMALYLPKSYVLQEGIPLLLAFDSHARSEQVMQNYTALAEKYNLILAVSTSSQNGLPPDESMRIARATLDDLLQRLSIDPYRIYLTGFSGGARVASLFAQQDPNIAGVIGCGAGFQPSANGQNFSYYGIVGLEDFNYLEMMGLDDLLASLGPPYRIVTWDGPHTWPPVEVMDEALHWMDYRAMAYGTMERDTAAISFFRMGLEEQIRVCNGADCYDLRKELVSYLRELMDVSTLKTEMRQIAQGDVYKAHLDAARALEANEIEQREIYQHAVATEDLPYWQNEVGQLNALNRRKELQGLNQRLLAFLSLTAYSYSNQYLNQNDLANAEHFIQVYALVDPPNSEHAYLEAKLRARQGRTAEIIPALARAVALGFADTGRMSSEPDFAPVQGEAGFQSLLRE